MSLKSASGVSKGEQLGVQAECINYKARMQEYLNPTYSILLYISKDWEWLSKQRSKCLLFLGVEVIDNDIDQMRNGMVLVVIEQSLHHQVKVQTLDVAFNALQQLLLLQALQFGQQAQQTLQADLQLFVVALLHCLVHSLCQDHMDVQAEDQRKVLHIDDRQYFLQESEDGLFERRYFFQEVNHFPKQLFGEDIRHKASVVVILRQEVKQVEAILPDLRQILHTSPQDFGERSRVVDLQLVSFHEFPVVFEYLEEIQKVLKVLMLAVILLNAAQDIQRVLDGLYGLFRHEAGFEDSDDDAQEMPLHYLYLPVLVFHGQLLLHIGHQFIHHHQDVQKQGLYFF